MKRRTKNKKLEVRIDEALLEQVKAVTHDCGTGMSDFVRDAITDKLQQLQLQQAQTQQTGRDMARTTRIIETPVVQLKTEATEDEKTFLMKHNVSPDDKRAWIHLKTISNEDFQRLRMITQRLGIQLNVQQ